MSNAAGVQTAAVILVMAVAVWTVGAWRPTILDRLLVRLGVTR